MEIKVENIKCGGCANGIVNSISKINGVDKVEVNVTDGIVQVLGDVDQKIVVQKLHALGYTLPGMGSGFTKATSYVSCMIGKISS